jgi:hypothetical protein
VLTLNLSLSVVIDTHDEVSAMHQCYDVQTRNELILTLESMLVWRRCGHTARQHLVVAQGPPTNTRAKGKRNMTS